MKKSHNSPNKVKSISLCSIHEWWFLNLVNNTPPSHDHISWMRFILLLRSGGKHKASWSGHSLPVASTPRVLDLLLHLFFRSSIKMYCFPLFMSSSSFISLDFVVSWCEFWTCSIFYASQIVFLYACTIWKSLIPLLFNLFYAENYPSALVLICASQSYTNRFFSFRKAWIIADFYTVSHHTEHCKGSVSLPTQIKHPDFTNSLYNPIVSKHLAFAIS